MVVKKLLPYGVKDYYPKEVERLKTILQRVEEELTLWGYEEIKLPLLEYRELFETALGKKIKDGFPIADGGEDLALRYDFTPQILRFVIHQKGKNYPLRVYYKGETFKKSRELWEEINVGFELVGARTGGGKKCRSRCRGYRYYFRNPKQVGDNGIHPRGGA